MEHHQPGEEQRDRDTHSNLPDRTSRTCQDQSRQRCQQISRNKEGTDRDAVRARKLKQKRQI
jgi:hypothetical protein